MCNWLSGARPLVPKSSRYMVRFSGLCCGPDPLRLSVGKWSFLYLDFRKGGYSPSFDRSIATASCFCACGISATPIRTLGAVRFCQASIGTTLSNSSSVIRSFERWQPWLGHGCDAFLLVQMVDFLHDDIQFCWHFLDFFCHIQTG